MFFLGNLSWLRECVDNKVGINGLDKAGNTALYWGCHGGHKGNTEDTWNLLVNAVEHTATNSIRMRNRAQKTGSLSRAFIVPA